MRRSRNLLILTGCALAPWLFHRYVFAPILLRFDKQPVIAGLIAGVVFALVIFVVIAVVPRRLRFWPAHAYAIYTTSLMFYEVFAYPSNSEWGLANVIRPFILPLLLWMPIFYAAGWLLRRTAASQAPEPSASAK